MEEKKVDWYGICERGRSTERMTEQRDVEGIQNWSAITQYDRSPKAILLPSTMSDTGFCARLTRSEVRLEPE